MNIASSCQLRLHSLRLPGCLSDSAQMPAYAIVKRIKKISAGLRPAKIKTFVLMNVTPQTATTASATR